MARGRIVTGAVPPPARWWLRDDTSVTVAYDDLTQFGSPMTQRPSRSAREVFAPVLEHARSHGFGDVLRAGPALLADVVASKAFADIAEPDEDGAWRVLPQVRYPEVTDCRPRWLSVAGPAGGRVTTEVPASAWPQVHELIARLTHGGHQEQRLTHGGHQEQRLTHGGHSERSDDDLAPDIAGLFERLRAATLLRTSTNEQTSGSGCDLTFAGHNTVVVRSAQSAVVVDPFLFPSSSSYPDSYQPLGVGHLGPVDAVLITHSHPDHFDPATLIRFRTDVRVIVPVTERETLLGADMRRRLAELGFTDVVALGWGETATAGDIVVHALPFYGEQPSDGHVLHPDVRNVGNTYVVATPTFSAAFLADSGRDHAGDVRDVPERWRREHPPVDVVFAGYRGWSTYPVQLFFSSVAAFMLFVPPTLWGCRHQLMTDAVDAVDVAERFGARYLVPYADGGAPWHWEIGLGPRLDGTGTEDPDFDPFPERVLDLARRRIRVPSGEMVPSPVRVRLLRPGDSLTDVAGEAGVVRVPGHSWAYPEAVGLG